MSDDKFAGLSFEQVVRKYKDTVGSVCMMRLKNQADVDDCFQNTFIRLYKKSPSLQSEEHLKAWLIRVAINECNRFMRKNRRELLLENDTEDVVVFPQEECDLSWALFRISEKYREVLYLHYCEDYKVAEIATILKKSPNTIKSLLMRGREKLKAVYGGENE